MTNYFPRQTVVWKMQETPGFRRLTLSVVEMALITGVLLRVFRAFVLANVPTGAYLYLGVAFAVGVLFLCAMATLHLGNYPVRHWLWRAPAFAGIAVGAEMVVCLVLILLHREPVGTGRAELADWPSLFGYALVSRVLIVCSFAAVLAGVVQLVRRWLLARDQRTHTADAVARKG